MNDPTPDDPGQSAARERSNLGPETNPSQRTRGRIARRIARGVANLVYREIDLRMDGNSVADGPVIAVANHFGGLADGVLLVDALGSRST